MVGEHEGRMRDRNTPDTGGRDSSRCSSILISVWNQVGRQLRTVHVYCEIQKSFVLLSHSLTYKATNVCQCVSVSVWPLHVCCIPAVRNALYTFSCQRHKPRRAKSSSHGLNLEAGAARSLELDFVPDIETSITAYMAILDQWPEHLCLTLEFAKGRGLPVAIFWHQY